MKHSISNSGMTLVELMMATTLAAIVMIPIGTLMVASFREPMIQQQIFSHEASTQGTIDLLREKIRGSTSTNITIWYDVNGDGIEFDNDNGATTYISKEGDTLIVERAGAEIALIERGVEAFSITVVSNLYRITLAASPAPRQAAVTYNFTYGSRN